MKRQMIRVTRDLGRFAINHGPEILTVCGGVGVILTAAATGKATLKAARLLEEMEYTSDHQPTTGEKAKVVIPRYIPPFILCAGTILCIFGAHKMHIQKQVALAAAYALADGRLREYKDHVVDEIGAKKAEALEDKIAQDKIRKNPPAKDGLNIIRTRNGDILFMDSFTSRYFYSSYEAIERAKNKVTAIAQTHMCASLNDFYEALEIPPAECGELLGWNICDIDNNIGSPTIPIITSRTCKTPTPEELPCTIIDYDIEPMIDYDKLV